MRPSRAVAPIAAALALAISACAQPDRAGDEAKALDPEQKNALDQAYFNLLSAERCARRATDQQAVALQLLRTGEIARRAQAEGLGQRLLAVRAKWVRFDEQADWVCGSGDPLANLTVAVDAFDRAVADAIADR